MNKCPCGSNREYLICCAPFINGTQVAPTPEALMRSRYTAYVNKNIDYIMQTMRGPAAKDFSAEDAKTSMEHATWQGLKILNTTPEGLVEFLVFYNVNGQHKILHEISEFRQHDGKWYYFDAKYPKIGRNDPCPCGSGKKYKKCCLK